MSAPEQQHVLPRISRQYHRRLIGLHTFEDVADILRREVGILIIYHSPFVQVLAIGISTHGPFVGVLSGVGSIVGCHEYDMVVIVSVMLQHLVYTQHVGLMAVVAPAVAALHQYGILTGEVGISHGNNGLTVFGVELLLGILHQIVPRC